MEKISDRIADKIALELKYDNNKKEIIAYGTFALLHTFISVFLTIVFGYLFGVVIEAIIISFTVSILRKYSGGVHASSSSNCTIIGLIICIGQASIISLIADLKIEFNIVLISLLMTFVWTCYIIYKLAPVDSPAKPIKREEKRKRMKKRSLITLIIYFIIVVFIMILYLKFKKRKFLTYTLCIGGGVLWQSFTLTKEGHLVLSKMDSFFNYIIKKVRK